MNEELDGIGRRLIELRAKLKAREGKKEYKENCEHIKREIARLEEITKPRKKRWPVASENKKDM